MRCRSLDDCTFLRADATRVFVDKDSVIVSVYNSYTNAVLSFYFIEKPEEGALYGCLAVYCIDPPVTAVIVGIQEPALLTVIANWLNRSDNVDVYAM
jgi:hypothetical protein